jgi:hypothetical protein
LVLLGVPRQSACRYRISLRGDFERNMQPFHFDLCMVRANSNYYCQAKKDKLLNCARRSRLVGSSRSTSTQQAKSANVKEVLLTPFEIWLLTYGTISIRDRNLRSSLLCSNLVYECQDLASMFRVNDPDLWQAVHQQVLSSKQALFSHLRRKQRTIL